MVSVIRIFGKKKIPREEIIRDFLNLGKIQNKTKKKKPQQNNPCREIPLALKTKDKLYIAARGSDISYRDKQFSDCRFSHHRPWTPAGSTTALVKLFKVSLESYSKKKKYRFLSRKIQEWRNQDISDGGNLKEFVSS